MDTRGFQRGNQKEVEMREIELSLGRDLGIKIDGENPMPRGWQYRSSQDKTSFFVGTEEIGWISKPDMLSGTDTQSGFRIGDEFGFRLYDDRCDVRFRVVSIAMTDEITLSVKALNLSMWPW